MVAVALVALATGALAPSARAEDEVRIALFDGRPQITVAGDALVVRDADVGDALVETQRRQQAQLQLRDGAVSVHGHGEAPRVARAVLIEARGALQVGNGVYFGRIEVRAEGAGLIAVNRIPLETYLLGIVGSEMNANWPLEALKAQAVASRTYAMERRVRMRAIDRPYDLESTVISQVYKGAEKITPMVIEAVKSTRGEVLAHHYHLALTLFHSTCGGETRDVEDVFGGSRPYLRPQICDWCRASSRYRWTKDVGLNEVARRLRAAGLVRGRVTGLRRGHGDSTLRVTAGGRAYHVEPREVRKAIGFARLYSTRFTAEVRGGRVRFEGRGFGHGVGMCQWGAYGQAKAGRTYRQILAHYYPGTRVKRLY